jgi:hypothetical protein
MNGRTESTLDALWLAEGDRPRTRDKTISEFGDPRRWPEYLHDMAWGGWEADGVTGRIGCTCGWEGTIAQFHEHTGTQPWTDDEIREAVANGRL